MSKKFPLRLTAVAFVAALTLAGTAEAGSFSAGQSSRATAETAPLSAAWGWLSGLWQDMTGSLLQMSASTTEPPTGQEGQCNDCVESDAGWVIDPNGGE
jgi:hypothetical protein